MAERNTTTGKKESKSKGTRAVKAKDEAPKPPAKKSRPRKAKPAAATDPEEKPVDETGVKLYAPRAEENDTPFSFDTEYSRAEPQTAGEPQPSPEPQAFFVTEQDRDVPVHEEEDPAASEDTVFAFVKEEAPAVENDPFAHEEPAGEASDGGVDFDRAFEPVSSLSETVAEAETEPPSLSAGFGDRREVEFELAQERIDSKMRTLVESQRTFFNTNQTRDVSFRILQLKKLYRAIQDNEELITAALQKDLAKSAYESYVTEIGLVLHEISYVIRHLKKWARPKKCRADLHLFPARFCIYTEPLGVSLILSTWNYPVLLSLCPIVSSIAAGNTVILKTSEYAVETNNALKAMLEKTFNSSYLAVVQGGYTENHALLEQHFDFIFFTGSQNVGRIVMSSAARFLTPVCLELGGKSPCIVDSSANLEIAARRIVWGKFLNAGQTCVAPDYVLVDKGVKDKLIDLMKGEILRQFGDKPLENKDYPKIINERRFVHLSTLCPKAEMDFVTNKISPTIMDLGDLNGREANDAEIMQEEIFGPLLPVLSFDNINTVMSYVATKPVPLSLYIFSTNADNIRRVTRELRFGGGCVNDVVYHLASSKAPFGGAGESGMGNYHGVYGFETFSHKKSVLLQSPKTDMKIRYSPYTDKMLRLLKKIIR